MSEKCKQNNGEHSPIKQFHTGTGSPVVDRMLGFDITGNVIPHSWYKTIVTEDGKPMVNAILILAEIVYWYRPTVERDPQDSGKITIKKRFHGDALQMGYGQLEEKFNLTHYQLRSAIVALENIGVIRRDFRSLTVRGIKLSNVMYIELDPDRLYELTYPAWLEEHAEKKQHTPTEKTSQVYRNTETAASENHRTNTKITPENTNEITDKDYLSIHQDAERAFKEQIEYDSLKLDHPHEMDVIDAMVEVAADLIVSPKKKCRVNGEEIPMARVQERFQKISFLTIKYILESLRSSATEVRNVRAMLITTMYNAPVTMDAHYEAKVRHDLAKKR